MSVADRGPLIEDRALRGSDLVLSTASLQDWMSESLDRPCHVVPRRLRYKAGTSAVLGFDLTAERDGVVITMPCVASIFSDDAAPKIDKVRRHLAPHVHLAHDTERHALVTTAEGDRGLPLLPRLGQPDGLVQLVGRLLPHAPDTAGTRIRTIRHNPGRRWVGTLERRNQPTILLRAYTDGPTMARAAACYRALTRATTPTPLVVARSRSFAVLAVTWVDGVDLGHLDDRLDLWEAAGRELARLHEGPAVRLRHPDPASEGDAVLTAGRQIAELLPSLADDVGDLARTTAGRLRQLPAGAQPIHGDFSPDQVVTRPDGLTTLIDLDAARLGTPAYDLGCLTASTMVCAEAASIAWRGEEQLAHFVRGYDSARRPPDASAVALHAVAFRLRKAADPFRECAPDWRTQVVRRVAAARSALDTAPVGRSAG